MTCLEFSQIARDYARQAWISGPVQAEASRHLDGCAGCRERLEQERELDRGLAEWRDAEPTLAPPAPLGALLAEFDRARPRRRRAVGPLLAWGAVAAAFCAGAIGLAWFRTDTAEGRNAPVAAVAEPAQHPNVVVSAEPPPAASQAPRPVAAARRPPAPGPRERVTAFLPIGSHRSMDPREDLRLLRIQLPESELLRFGLPVAPRLEPGYVRADVLLGEDGLARAIRFVY